MKIKESIDQTKHVAGKKYVQCTSNQRFGWNDSFFCGPRDANLPERVISKLKVVYSDKEV
jgi:hypothetical protein